MYWSTPSARVPVGCSTGGIGKASTKGVRPQSTLPWLQELFAPWKIPPALSQSRRLTKSEQVSSTLQQAPAGCGHWLGTQVSTPGSVAPLQSPEFSTVSEQLPSAWQQASTAPVGVKSMVSVGGAAPSRLSKRRVVVGLASSPINTQP